MGRDYFITTQISKPSLHIWTWHKDHAHQRSFPPEQITSLACTIDGAYCAAGGISGAVHLWETSTGRLIRSWPAHYKRITCLAFSASGAELISGGEDTLVSAWLLVDVLDILDSVEDGDITASVAPLHAWSDHTMPITSVAVGAGCVDPLVVSVSFDRSLKIRSLASGAVLRSVAFPVPLSTVSLDLGEHAVYAGSAMGTIFHVSLVGGGGDGEACSLVGLPTAAPAPHAAVSADDTWVAMKGHSKAVTCLAFTADAAHLVSGSEDGCAKVWDLRTLQPVRTISAPAKVPISGLLLLPQRPVHMPLGAQGGEGYGGRKGPKRLQPLAQFSKYIGAASPAKPWEGGFVVLDGSGGGYGVCNIIKNSIDNRENTGGGICHNVSSNPILREGGGIGGDADVTREIASLREENEALQRQVDQALTLAQKWKTLNQELQEVALGSEGR